MKFLTCLFVFSLSLISSTFAVDFGIKVGPFDLQLRGGSNLNRAALIENPICYAIKARKQIELTVERELVSDDKKPVLQIRRVVLEPYIFGFDDQDQPVLRGNVVSERLLKEAPVLYAEGHGPESSQVEKKGFFSGVFSSQTNVDIQSLDLRRVSDLHVVENSSFKPPKDVDSIFGGDPIQIICHVTRTIK